VLIAMEGLVSANQKGPRVAGVVSESFPIAA
jgi:hypothetical protein